MDFMEQFVSAVLVPRSGTPSLSSSPVLQKLTDVPENEKGAEAKQVKKLLKRHPSFFTVDIQRVSRNKKIGKGSFGTVYKAKYQGEVVAMKRIYAEKAITYKYIVREIETLRQLSHPNVLRFIGVAHKNSKEIYLITELVDGVTLKHINRGKWNLTWPQKCDLLLQVARGMAYLADNTVIHRDLKSENILVSKELEAKICDFGLARTVEDRPPSSDSPGTQRKSQGPGGAILERKMTVVGSNLYMAPEVSGRVGYSFNSDVYAFGVMVAEMMGVKFTGVRKAGAGFDYDEFVKKKKPAPDGLLQVVNACVLPGASARPSFVQLVEKLTEILKLMGVEVADEVAEEEESPEVRMMRSRSASLVMVIGEDNSVSLSEANDTETEAEDFSVQLGVEFDDDDDPLTEDIVPLPSPPASPVVSRHFQPHVQSSLVRSADSALIPPQRKGRHRRRRSDLHDGGTRPRSAVVTTLPIS